MVNKAPKNATLILVWPIINSTHPNEILGHPIKKLKHPINIFLLNHDTNICLIISGPVQLCSMSRQYNLGFPLLPQCPKIWSPQTISLFPQCAQHCTTPSTVYSLLQVSARLFLLQWHYSRLIVYSSKHHSLNVYSLTHHTLNVYLLTQNCTRVYTCTPKVGLAILQSAHQVSLFRNTASTLQNSRANTLKILRARNETTFYLVKHLLFDAHEDVTVTMSKLWRNLKNSDIARIILLSNEQNPVRSQHNQLSIRRCWHGVIFMIPDKAAECCPENSCSKSTTEATRSTTTLDRLYGSGSTQHCYRLRHHLTHPLLWSLFRILEFYNNYKLNPGLKLFYSAESEIIVTNLIYLLFILLNNAHQ